MRMFVIGLAGFLVLLPTLLILFARGKPLLARLFWAALAFFAPIVMIMLVRALPILSNNSPDSSQWERMLGLLFAAFGFLLPWLFFARFLHRHHDANAFSASADRD